MAGFFVSPQYAWRYANTTEGDSGSGSECESKEWRPSWRWQTPLLVASCAALTVALLVLHWRRFPRTDVSSTIIFQPPPFASNNEIELKRLSMLRENKRVPSVVHRDGAPLPGVALVFLTIRGVRHHTLWQRWFEDAYAWLEAEGLETTHDDTKNATEHRSNVIRAYVHHAYWLDPTLKIPSVPPAMRPGIIEDGADCIWRMINPCFHRGLKEAVDKFERAEWFYTVASDAVPVKPFSEMYKSLLEDPRNRLEFAKMVFDRHAPKVFNWVLFTREIASVLVGRPDDWVHEMFRTIDETGSQAGSDEWAVYLPLLDHFGEGFFFKQHPGVVLLKYEVRPLDSSVNTFACWGSCASYGSIEGSGPHLFRALNRTGFERMHSSATVTHARKFDLNSTVNGCPARRHHVAAPAEKTLSLDHLRSKQRANVTPDKRTTSGRNRTGIINISDSWATSNFGPYYAQSICSITDFITWRLNLNSTAIEPEEQGSSTLHPPGYQWFYNLEQQKEALVSSGIFGVRPEIIAEYASKTTTTSKT